MSKKKIRPPKGNSATGKIKAPSTEKHNQNMDREHPVFSLSEMVNGVYCLDCCTNEEKLALIVQLRKLSQLTWQQLKAQPRHQMGFEKIEFNAITGANTAAKKQELENNGFHLIAFRFYGLAPMVGYRDGKIFHILWLDRQFNLYDHG